MGPSQYYTTLGLSWDAMLKTTEMELEFSTDIDIYNLVLRGFRGAIVQWFNWYSIANDKYISVTILPLLPLAVN